MIDWQPSASIATLQQRAHILHQIRQFFHERAIMEVETPLLCQHTVTDPYIDSFAIADHQPPYYLQTSPEYSMKRLLAAGSGPIYQISKAFRREEQGSLHNPEFTLLEWYRPGFTHLDLIDEIDTFLQTLIQSKPAQKITYHDLFDTHFAINPHTCSLESLHQCVAEHINAPSLTSLNRDDCLNLLLTHVIEPTLGIQSPTFIYDYPASQAALAQIRKGSPSVAERFELYINGIELANGFHELQDADEQYHRFQQDLQNRQQLNKALPKIDQRFITALQAGLPACAGVALGIDRLVTLACSHDALSESLSFDWPRA